MAGMRAASVTYKPLKRKWNHKNIFGKITGGGHWSVIACFQGASTYELV